MAKPDLKTFRTVYIWQQLEGKRAASTLTQDLINRSLKYENLELNGQILLLLISN